MTELEGGCHCGAVTVRFATTRAPAELPVRTCGCTFCRKHRPHYTSDPAGHVTVRARRDRLARYRFGLALADFLICQTCGVFVAALEPGAPGRAVVNLVVLVASERADRRGATVHGLRCGRCGGANRSTRAQLDTGDARARLSGRRSPGRLRLLAKLKLWDLLLPSCAS